MNGNNLNATLDNQALVSQKGMIHNFSVSVDNSVEILFTLTAESSAFLVQQGTSLSIADLRDSQGNLLLSLGDSLMLQPGTYELEGSLNNTFTGVFDGGGGTTGAELDLEFSPVVPEPRWSWLAPAALIGLALLYRRRTA